MSYAPRLCHVVKWEDFDGYGFNLHAGNNKPGQYIGKVDPDSPAETAGLKQGDKIIEVNGVNISNENHKQVVQRIKAVPNETKLLVVDLETEKYFKERNIIIKGTASNVIHFKTPVPRGAVNGVQENGGQQITQENVERHDNVEEERSMTSERSSHSSAKSDKQTSSPQESPASNHEAKQYTTNQASRAAANKNSGLNLNMTAAEMRAHLASRKKTDPRKDTAMDFRKKYEIIQTM